MLQSLKYYITNGEDNFYNRKGVRSSLRHQLRGQTGNRFIIINWFKLNNKTDYYFGMAIIINNLLS